MNRNKILSEIRYQAQALLISVSNNLYQEDQVRGSERVTNQFLADRIAKLNGLLVELSRQHNHSKV